MRSQLRFGHLNAQSIMGHITDLRLISDKFNLDIFGISESFLKPHILNRLIDIPGFEVVRNDRLGKECGGVALYVREDLKSRVIDSSPALFSGNPEFLIVEVKGDGMPALLVCVMYRAPRLRLPIDFWTALGRFFAILLPYNYNG